MEIEVIRERSISGKVLRWAKQYPVVTVTGPRQSGKSTLCKHYFSEKSYVIYGGDSSHVENKMAVTSWRDIISIDVNPFSGHESCFQQTDLVSP